MHAILLIGLVSACAAAPHFHYGPPTLYPPQDFPANLFAPLGNNFLDTSQLYMPNKMRELETKLQHFYISHPASMSWQGIENGVYKITIPLSGFQEKDIVVKAREEVLMVQAVHKDEWGGENSHLDIKSLPNFVDVRGSWQYDGGVLLISFPLKESMVEGARRNGEDREGGEEAPVTEPSHQVLTLTEDDADAEILARGDHEHSWIPRSNVEATTYSVDLDDEIENVPIHDQQI